MAPFLFGSATVGGEASEAENNNLRTLSILSMAYKVKSKVYDNILNVYNTQFFFTFVAWQSKKEVITKALMLKIVTVLNAVSSLHSFEILSTS